jgi:hypothetical protein
MKVFGIAKELLLTSPVFFGVTLWSMIFYYFLWSRISPRLRIRFNNALITDSYERAELDRVLQKIKGKTRSAIEALIENYMAHLFVRRTYAVQAEELPHPFLDPLYREIMLDYAMPVWREVSPEDNEDIDVLEDTLERLDEMEDAPEGRVLPKNLRQRVKVSVERVNEFWEISDPSEKAAAEVVAAMNLKRKRQWSEYIIPFLAWIREYKHQDENERLEKQLQSFLEGRSIPPPFSSQAPEILQDRRRRRRRRKSLPVFWIVLGGVPVALVVILILWAALTPSRFDWKILFDETVEIPAGGHRCFKVKKTGSFRYTLKSSEPVDSFMIPMFASTPPLYNLKNEDAIRDYLDLVENEEKLRKIKFITPMHEEDIFDEEILALLNDDGKEMIRDILKGSMLYRMKGSAREARDFRTKTLGPHIRVNWILVRNCSKKRARTRIRLEYST